jgi:ABC-2 type transport system ATP-binding protein
MLRLTNLRKSFDQTVAVADLSLEIRTGEIFGLLGPNGAGKSTTIGMAVGLIAPDSGTVEIEGSGDPSRPEARAKIGVAPQSVALYEDLTGRENLAFFGSLYAMRSGTLAARVDELLRLVGLEDRAGDRVKVYSGGMKRRLNLAAALVHDPPLVLLDEPTVGVDPQSRNAIFEIVRGVREAGKTVVYTTHYMEEAEKLCDRVGIIDHGKLLALDTVEGLLAAHGGQSVVVAQMNGEEKRVTTAEPLKEIAEFLRRGEMRSVRIERPDLEAVFLGLTGRTLRD